ncbi:MAG: hypothetical protein M3Z06_02900 [Actinomycetota bacterium]|nr:hypothetical protein [Actinomycetota bacterium]
MRNANLHAILEAFTSDSALQLTAETAGGSEIPFEVIETDGGRRGRVPLYCYRPLTGAFIRERLGLLSALPTYAPAARALADAAGTEAYLRLRGEARIPAEARQRADAALRCFLARVFEERSEFGLDSERFEAAYQELERALYEGRCLSTVIVPLLGVALDRDTRELPLGEGLSLIQGDSLADGPTEAVWGAAGPDGFSEDPNVLACLTVTRERSAPAPVAIARARFRRVLTALRLFERGGYALGPIAWTRTDDGAWRSVAFGTSGRPRLITLIPVAQEDELRAFCNLILRRAPSGGELAWALARFEMGCERLAPFEALTDYLLALRVLLEPEGPSSGRLAQRLSILCAQPAARVELAERTAQAISLERAVIAGLAPGDTDPTHPVDSLVDGLAEHLRALLRDVLCGHLNADLRAIADELLAEAAAAA